MRTPDVRAEQRPRLPDPGLGRLAVFDLDRTLLRGSSLLPLGRALAARRLVPRRRLAAGALRQAAYVRRGSTDGQVERLRQGLLSAVEGMRDEPLAAIATEVANALVADLTPGARLLLDRHRQAGDFCVILSASPHELVDAVSSRLGAQRGIGTRGEVVDGRYTGRLEGPLCYGQGKLERLRAVLGPVELADAWSYADSMSDLPLLDACGHPVAVNPDHRLSQIATERGWPVVRI